DETTGATEEPTTAEPFVPMPARGGIKIVRVEANPGVAVPIGLDGAPVGGAGRNAFIPGSRNLLIRAYVDLPEDWIERPIEARLQLVGGGVDKVMTQTVTLSSDSVDADLKSTFYFGVEAVDVVPGLKYQVELWEAAAGAEDLPEPAEPAVALRDGPSFVGVESDLAEMRVVLVPIDYSFGNCAAVVDGEAHRKDFEAGLYQQNAISALELTVHAPYKVEYSMTEYSGLSKLVSAMSQLRTDEGADPNVYYYGLFDNCGGCIGAGDGLQAGCTVGLAADITGPDENDARFRAAAGQLNKGAVDTFVHEVGHTQGRRHIECAGAGVQAAGTDPSYPYEDGRIGVWGFGIRDFGLRHPTVYSDYMSYCGRTWVSDWQWNATYTRIKKLTGWGKSGAGAPATGDGVLIGAVDPDGQQIWWTGPGDLSSEREPSATHRVIFEFADGEVETTTQVSVREHYATRNIVARLPEGFDERELIGVRWADEQGEQVVAPKLIRRLHKPVRLQTAQ
ncbi:MAG TPA: hypothetical protein VGB85_00190, partial [Nannocystis sp.]